MDIVAPQKKKRKASAFGEPLPPKSLPEGWSYVCDTNEHAGDHKGYFLLNGNQLDLANLWVGDYTVRDPTGRLHDRFCSIERKSLVNITQEVPEPNKERWERALARMSELAVSAVIVEADWSAVAQRQFLPRSKSGKERRGVHPNSLVGAIISWQMDTGVPFNAVSNRIEGERITRWLLCNYAHRVATGVLELVWPETAAQS